MASCPAGQAVEITLGALGQNAIVLPSFFQTSSIIVDFGVEVDGSRSPADYGGGSCGTMSTSGSTSCQKWIKVNGQSNIGIYGPGVWNGRAWDKFTTGATGQSFYLQRMLTYCVAHGGSTINGSPTCPSGLPAYAKAYGPNGLEVDSTTGYTTYKMALRDSGNFLFNLHQSSKNTNWGLKLIDPFEVPNTDGWDPESSTDSTFTYGFVNDGDNPTALKSTESVTQNISFINSQTGAGTCIAIGTDITHNIKNYLVSDIVQRGNLNNQNSCGMQICDGPACAGGSYTGTVDQVTYQNICTQNENRVMNFSVSNSTVTNLLLQRITALAPTSSVSWQSGVFNFDGNSSTDQMTMQLDNVQVVGTNHGGSSSNALVYLGPGTVTSSIQTNLGCGTGGVTCAGTPSAAPAYCTSNSWQQLTGELNILTSTSNLNQSVTFTSSTPFTLQAVVQPTTAINDKEQPFITGGVQFYDNGNPLGSPVPMGGDGFYAALAVPSVSSGTHIYTAQLVGDAYYNNYAFGSVKVVNGSVTTPTTLTGSGTITWSGTITIQ